MSNVSRVLKSGSNQITQTYQQHVAKVESGSGWAKGTDVVLYPTKTDSIIAHSDGTVLYSMTGQTNMSKDPDGMGYGNYVMILHKNNYVTLYAHLSSVKVKMGDKITKGMEIGYMGNTGNSFGAHLHFEVRRYSKTPVKSMWHNTNEFEWLDSSLYLNANLPTDSSVVTPTSPKVIENRYKVMYGSVQKGAYTNYDYAVNAADKINGYILDSVNGLIIYRTKTITQNSYPDYAVTSKKYYRIRKSWSDAGSQKGAYAIWKNAYSAFQSCKNTFHIYDNDGKQLD